ncbi:hypothetical protein V865_001638 [Kwoniella europaea PYCC6329]|uniref:Uncharacterized protein n=1 Tax=Kwoniella europaea PYCC6329 TaxID=1423913 RepID=A0AAX4KCB6_9TREE
MPVVTTENNWYPETSELSDSRILNFREITHSQCDYSYWAFTKKSGQDQDQSTEVECSIIPIRGQDKQRHFVVVESNQDGTTVSNCPDNIIDLISENVRSVVDASENVATATQA